MNKEATILALYDALKWFVENDETNRGGHWEEDNAYWIAGLNRGCDALALVDPEEAERLRNNSFNTTAMYYG